MTTFHRVMITFIRNENNEIIFFWNPSEHSTSDKTRIRWKWKQIEFHQFYFVIASKKLHNKETLIYCEVEIKIRSIYHWNDFL